MWDQIIMIKIISRSIIVDFRNSSIQRRDMIKRGILSTMTTRLQKNNNNNKHIFQNFKR